jgi:hypothetical protein
VGRYHLHYPLKHFDSFGIEHMEGVGGLHGWQWIVSLSLLATLYFVNAIFI